MTDRAEIERLLKQTGRTLDGLPTQDDYWYADDYVDRNEEIGMMMYRSGFKRNEPYIMHQSDVIELLVGALRDAQTERDAALAKVPKWIGVEDRLPDALNENNQMILTEEVIGFDGECCFVGQFRIFKFDGSADFAVDLGIKADVTHWMPLPEPPEEEG